MRVRIHKYDGGEGTKKGLAVNSGCVFRRGENKSCLTHHGELRSL